MAVLGSVLIDGVAFDADDASISVFDIGFQRGYGCFEAMRAYNGSIFRLGPHLDRLERSATKLHLPTPDRDAIGTWCRSVAAAAGDSVVRAFMSGGTDAKAPGTNSRIVVFAEAVPFMPSALALQTRVAPWHTDGEWFELTGAKGLSYGFNLVASIAAAEDGFDDALLIGRRGHVLEGPTFSIGWVSEGIFHTPGTEIGILESITRRAVIDAAARIGVDVREGTYGTESVMDAEEVIAMSTVRQVLPVIRVDTQTYRPGIITRALQGAFASLVDEELAR
ncbi:MAG TPA: aminotransferase class IV [Acidimicrobiia bacterium]|nr:aminotransferase class IV [Acidimicrobiia bacterium]